MNNDKIIEFDIQTERPDVHRLPRKMPELHARYGLWIINASAAVRSPENGFFRCRPRKFEFYSISHLTEGAGRCWIEGCGERDIRPGQLVVVTPGVLNRYGGASGKPYVEDSIRFIGPIANMLHNSGILLNGVWEFGSARRLLPIMTMIQDPSRDAQINANITLQKLLVDLYFERNRTSLIAPVDELLEEVRSRPAHWWTVEEMAEFCNLSTDQFRRNFERRTGMRPKRYLEEFKLRQAAELLVSGNSPVAEIAFRLGYRDPYHFSRRFKRFAGVSPERYRREFPNFSARFAENGANS